MAKKNDPPPPPKKPSGNPLMQCPNYNTCQTMVRASNRGNPHKYGVYDAAKDDIVYKDCNGG